MEDVRENDYRRQVEGAGEPSVDSVGSGKLFGSSRLFNFMSGKVRKDSWLSWGLVLLLGFAVFAIIELVSVVFYFVR